MPFKTTEGLGKMCSQAAVMQAWRKLLTRENNHNNNHTETTDDHSDNINNTLFFQN